MGGSLWRDEQPNGRARSNVVNRYGAVGCECLDDEECHADPTGFWSEEFVTPHRKFTDGGFKVAIATPGGVNPTVDPLSFQLSYNHNDANAVAQQKDYMKRLGLALTSPARVEDIDPDAWRRRMRHNWINWSRPAPPRGTGVPGHLLSELGYRRRHSTRASAVGFHAWRIFEAWASLLLGIPIKPILTFGNTG